MAIANIAKHCMEMEIPKISKLNEILSPEISIHGIPWQIKVRKEAKDAEQTLGIYLCCVDKDKSPNWPISGTASFKLLPFNDEGNPIEYHSEPYAFSKSGTGYGTHSLIKWNDLLNLDKKTVKNDTINLEVKITAENPNNPNRSRLKFECLDKCCDNQHSATFRLTVTNILNLMAIQSPEFTLRGLLWDIQISKTRSPHIDILLQLKMDSGNKPSKMSMTIKIISSKQHVQPIKKCITKEYQYLRNLKGLQIISWDEMVKPENGFVINDSITLEIKIHASEPEDDPPMAKRLKLNPEIEAKTPQMECPICFKCIAEQELAVTPCGHLFCFECIKKAIKKRAACPACNKIVRSKTLRQLYLPGVH